MQARHEAGRGTLVKRMLELLVESERQGVLDGRDACVRLAEHGSDPCGMVDGLHVHVPDALRGKPLLERPEVTRVGVQPRTLGRDDGSVGYLVVHHPLGERQPANVGVVPQHNGVVPAIGHQSSNQFQT